MYKIYAITNGLQADITEICSGIKWEDSIDTLGMQFDFTIPNSININNKYVDIGSLLLFSNSYEIFRGIVVSDNKDKNTNTFTCFDYAFYLNKSREIYQFNNETADNCIKKICSDFNVPISYIPPFATKIKKIYYNEELSAIIKDILNQVALDDGRKFFMEMNEGKLYIDIVYDQIVNATFTNAFGETEDCTKYISNPSRSRSIADMKNSIKIIVSNTENDNETVQLVATAKDDSNIKKYGLLQDVQANSIASNSLKDLNKILESNSISLIGSDNVKANRVLNITEIYTGMSGKYLVTKSSHTLNNGISKMTLDLEVV